MDEVLRFFRAYEVWIYLILGLGGLIYLRRFLNSWRDFRSTIFGLERERAQNYLNQAIGILVLIVIMVIAEFVVVNFVAPLRPSSNPLFTPTLDILMTPTLTLDPQFLEEQDLFPGLETPIPSPTLDARIGTCIADQIEIISPKPGDRISGAVPIEGSANIPNFGFYKLEVAPIQEINWRTIQAGRDVVQSGVLVQNWDTTNLQAGDYILRLVVTDNNGQSSPDCQVPITIARQ